MSCLIPASSPGRLLGGSLLDSPLTDRLLLRSSPPLRSTTASRRARRLSLPKPGRRGALQLESVQATRTSCSMQSILIRDT